MPLSDSILKKIEEYAVHMDWDVAFEGKSKGNLHLFRVNKLSRHLQVTEGGDLDIIMAGAWLHDVGLVEGNKGHCFIGAIMAKTFLEDLGIDNETIGRIQHCITAHDGEVLAATTEAQVVHDADTVDKMGPQGLIRHAWKLANASYHTFTVDDLLYILPKHLASRGDNLYFDSAISIVDRYQLPLEVFFGNDEMAKRILDEVVSKAREGVPSDEILKGLISSGELPEGFIKALGEQNELSFL
jgi:hypothetical protein